ncbi:MAG: recombinase family protein [Desulfurococcaceae archaeon]
MDKALAYIRVSREDENPENQIHAILEWAKKNGVEVLGFYVDVDISGVVKPRERPQYQSMIQAAKTLGVKLLLFYDLSRLSRRLEDGLEELKQLTEEGFIFKFVAQEFLDYITDPLLRKKVISDFLWFAELYREDVRRRTKAGLERVKKEGKKLGRPSYPLPIDEIKQLMKKGLPLTKIHKLLVAEKKICREVKGKGEDCMKYETFRRKVKQL